MTNDNTPRLLFGKPIRQETTAEAYPSKITMLDFIEFMREDLDAFEADALTHGGIGTRKSTHEAYIEDWCEMFLGWCEIEEER